MWFLGEEGRVGDRGHGTRGFAHGFGAREGWCILYVSAFLAVFVSVLAVAQWLALDRLSSYSGWECLASWKTRYVSAQNAGMSGLGEDKYPEVTFR